MKVLWNILIKNTLEYANHTGHSRQNRGEPALSKNLWVGKHASNR